MAYKMSKKDKAEQYDKVAAEKGHLELMLFDVINSKVVYGAWVKESIDTYTGKMRVGISWRGMPLVIVEWHSGNKSNTSVHVDTLENYTEYIIEGRKYSEAYESQAQALASAKEKLFASLGVAA